MRRARRSAQIPLTRVRSNYGLPTLDRACWPGRTRRKPRPRPGVCFLIRPRPALPAAPSEAFLGPRRTPGCRRRPAGQRRVRHLTQPATVWWHCSPPHAAGFKGDEHGRAARVVGTSHVWIPREHRPWPRPRDAQRPALERRIPLPPSEAPSRSTVLLRLRKRGAALQAGGDRAACVREQPRPSRAPGRGGFAAQPAPSPAATWRTEATPTATPTPTRAPPLLHARRPPPRTPRSPASASP